MLEGGGDLLATRSTRQLLLFIEKARWTKAPSSQHAESGRDVIVHQPNSSAKFPQRVEIADERHVGFRFGGGLRLELDKSAAQSSCINPDEPRLYELTGGIYPYVNVARGRRSLPRQQ